MKEDGTLMNSFLFNLFIILLCSFTILHQCADAFGEFGRYSTLKNIFSYQIEYIDYVGLVFKYNLFLYGLLGIALLTTFFLLVCPSVYSKKKRTFDLALKKRVKAGEYVELKNKPKHKKSNPGKTKTTRKKQK